MRAWAQEAGCSGLCLELNTSQPTDPVSKSVPFCKADKLPGMLSGRFSKLKSPGFLGIDLSTEALWLDPHTWSWDYKS